MEVPFDPGSSDNYIVFFVKRIKFDICLRKKTIRRVPKKRLKNQKTVLVVRTIHAGGDTLFPEN